MSRLFLLIFFVFTVSCQSMGDVKKVLTNQKIKTTDEFFVKKKDPLELPPEFKKIPEPGSLKDKKNKEISEDEKIKQILRVPNDVVSNDRSSSSIEDAILNQIRK